MSASPLVAEHARGIQQCKLRVLLCVVRPGDCVTHLCSSDGAAAPAIVAASASPVDGSPFWGHPRRLQCVLLRLEGILRPFPVPCKLSAALCDAVVATKRGGFAVEGAAPPG
jgi:hypothetical protein